MNESILIIFLVVFVVYKWIYYTPLKRLQIASTVYCLYLLFFKGIYLFIITCVIILIWNLPKFLLWQYNKHIRSILEASVKY